ncbi:MAG: transcriptional regulator [Saprospiraceae bacterium]
MPKDLIGNLNKAFNHKIRLGIMSLLMVNDWVDFNTMKDSLGELNDGTLASHIKGLEKLEYLEVRKQFIGRKPNTSYHATTLGKKAFNDHLDALEALLNLRS